jgi:hypothetical protein
VQIERRKQGRGQGSSLSRHFVILRTEVREDSCKNWKREGIKLCVIQKRAPFSEGSNKCKGLEASEKALKGFEQRGDVIWSTFSSDCSSNYIANVLKEDKGKHRSHLEGHSNNPVKREIMAWTRGEAGEWGDYVRGQKHRDRDVQGM